MEDSARFDKMVVVKRRAEHVRLAVPRRESNHPRDRSFPKLGMSDAQSLFQVSPLVVVDLVENLKSRLAHQPVAASL